MFVMSICILGGITGVLLFGKRIQENMVKARSKNGMLGALLTSVMSMAIIEAFLPIQIIKGPVFAAVAITACVLTFIQTWIVNKLKINWYRSFIMAVTLILGMASSLLWIQILS